VKALLFIGSAACAATLVACASNSRGSAVPSAPDASTRVPANVKSAKSTHALYVLDIESSGDAIRVYKGGGATFLRIVQPALKSLLQYAVDRNGRLYVGSVGSDGQGPGTLSVYTNRGSTLIRSFKQRESFAGLIADDRSNLFSFCTGDNICELANARKPVSRKLKGVSYPLAVDPSGNLAAYDCTGWGRAEACVFAPGETAPSWKITSGVSFPDVYDLAFDPSGNLYVPNLGNNTQNDPGNVAVFAPLATSPTRVITSGIAAPISVAVDSAGTLYAYNECSGSYTSRARCTGAGSSITVYTSGESTPTRKITTGVEAGCIVPFWLDPGASCLAVDSSGNIYAVNSGVSVVEYKPGSNTPFRTLTDAQYPIAVSVGP